MSFPLIGVAVENISRELEGMQWEYMGNEVYQDPMRMCFTIKIHVRTPDGVEYSQEFLHQHHLPTDWAGGARSLRNKILGVPDGA